MIDTILGNPWLAALVILVSQIGFIYFRTLNVIYTAEMRIIPAILTGNAVGICWLISMSIGLNSVMTGDVLPVMAFLLGGTLGTYWGIKQERKKHGKE